MSRLKPLKVGACRSLSGSEFHTAGPASMGESPFSEPRPFRIRG